MKDDTHKAMSAEILVVDDIPANLMMLTGILIARGYGVRSAGSGRLALKSIALKKPDLILLDVKMPEMDGFEVCRALKSDEKNRDIPVIFISALNETEDKLNGFAAGGVDFITKPFQAQEVLARVETHLSLRRLQARLERQNKRLQQEIAERKRVEAALRQSETRYRTVFENTGTALIILEENTGMSLVNTQCEKLSGYTKEELQGKKSWTEFVIPEDLEKMKRNHVPRRSDPGAVPASYEFRFVDRHGEIRNVIANVARIPESRKSVASLMDISDLRKMESLLQKTLKWESIGIFAGGIAHDFNNLLGIIMGNIDLAQMEMQMRYPESEVQEFLKDAERACLQSKHLTQRLITLTGGEQPIKRPQSIRELIMNAVVEGLEGANVRCQFDLAEDLWPVDCDAVQIKNMIVNLILNAREAMETGDGAMEVCAGNELLEEGSVLYLKKGKYVSLSITDHGKGLLEEHLFRVFDPYFSTKQRGQQKGMGLGLSMAYAVVKKHDGDISITSKAGQGTTVHVYLPAVEERSPGGCRASTEDR